MCNVQNLTKRQRIIWTKALDKKKHGNLLHELELVSHKEEDQKVLDISAVMPKMRNLERKEPCSV